MSEKLNAVQQNIADSLQEWWGLGKYRTQLIFGPTSDEAVQTFIYTPERSYKIVAHSGYLGAYMSMRKPRAGENWLRGSDLPDGKFNKSTWDRIMASILSLEIETSIGKTLETVSIEEELKEDSCQAHVESVFDKCKAIADKDKPESPNKPQTVVKKRFEHVVETINEKFGDGYATKNPDLVKFLMVEISQEIQNHNQNEYN